MEMLHLIKLQKYLTKKAAEFKHEEYKEYIYLLNNITPTIVIHPSLVEKTKMI
jgi:hypothetical protein